MTVVVLSNTPFPRRAQMEFRGKWAVMEAYGFNSKSQAIEWARAFERKKKKQGEMANTLVQKMSMNSQYGPWAVFRLLPMGMRSSYAPPTAPRGGGQRTLKPGTRYNPIYRPSNPGGTVTPRRTHSQFRQKRMPPSPPPKSQVAVSGCPPNCSERSMCNHPYFVEMNMCPRALLNAGIVTREQLKKDIEIWANKRRRAGR